MLEIKPFQTKDYSSAAPYDLEFSGRGVSGVGIRFSATLANSATGIVDDAAFRLIKTPEINQAELAIVRMRGQSWRHLSAFADGTYDNHIASQTIASANAYLDFQKWMPKSGFNAGDKKIFIRGEFNPLSSYATGTNPTLTSGKFRPYVQTSQLDMSQGFWRPRFSEVTIPITVANDDQQHQIKFEQDQLVHGFMLTCDNSTTGNPRTDGLIRALRMDATTGEFGTIEAFRGNWGQARHNTQRMANFNLEDYNRSTGVVFIPTRDQRNRQSNGAKFFRNGDSITFHFDSSSTIDDEYTAATIAAGAQVVITTVAFTPVSGTGVSAAQLASLYDPTAAHGAEGARRASQRLAA